jgi:serine/threonine protein kinase
LCIFTRPDRQLVIAEFGLLHIREIHKQYFAAPTGALADGSSESCSPEQWLNKPIGTYADMYALGAVLYRLLTGHAPFEGNTRAEVMQKHLSAMPPAMSVWRSDLPPALDTLFAKALAKEPEQRFQRPEELLQAYWQIVSPEETVRLRPRTPQVGVGQAVYPLPPSPPSPRPGNAAVSKSASLPRIPVASVPRIPVVSVSTPLASKSGTTVTKQASRRRLFTLLALGGAGAVALLAAVESGLFHGSTSAPGTGRARGSSRAAVGRVVARVADIPLNSAKTFPLNNGQPNPGIIVHLPDNRFVAFDSTCTHEGCAVSYVPTDHQLLCPCHSAMFDPAANAAVTRGPAVTPLAPIKIRVNADGTIIV